MLRRLYRHMSRRLPPALRVRATMGLLHVRRRLRARRGLVDVPGGGRPVMFVALGLDPTALAAFADDAAQARRAGLAPLVVTDCDALGLLRDRQLLFEYVPPRGDFLRAVGTDADYEAFVSSRLDRIASVYRLEERRCPQVAG